MSTTSLLTINNAQYTINFISLIYPAQSECSCGGDEGYDVHEYKAMYNHDLLYKQAYHHFGFANIVPHFHGLDYVRHAAK
jgi:hypothetical protein